MSDHLRRTTDLLGAGSLARALIPTILQHCHQMHAVPTLNTVGLAEFNRATNNRQLQLAQAGVIDVSPQVKEMRTAIGYAGSDIFAEEQRDSWEQPAYHMVDRVVRATEQRRLVGSQVLWVQGMSTGHATLAKEMLLRLKERKPDKFIIGKSTVSEDADQRPKAVIGYTLFHELHDTHTLATTILSDNHSKFALKFKLSTQDNFEARAIAALLAAQPQFGKNKSLAEIGMSLGQHSPFVGWSFCSRPLEPIKDGLGWSIVRAFGQGLPHRGVSNVAHVINEARIATEKATTEDTARAIDDDIDLSQPMFIVYIVPIALTERKQWETFSNEIRRWLAVNYENAIPIFLSGQGQPDPRYLGSYWLQVSTLFPLPAVPRPIRDYVAPEPKKVVSLPEMPTSATHIPRALSSNGHAFDYIPEK